MYSRFLHVVVQDHKFNTRETCAGILSGFKRFGGRVATAVIDQDAVLIYEEKNGEIVTTRMFDQFLAEQGMNLWVCRKADT